jgi:hypothetical protein
MARYFYGGSGADVIARPISDTDDDLELALGVTYSVYTARTGGTVVTDLLTADGAVISQVTPDEHGVRFQGPDGMIQALWLQNQSDAAEPRWAVIPSAWGEILSLVLAQVTPPIVREATAIDQTPFSVKGMAGQTGALFQARASDDSIIFSITADGELRIGPGVGGVNGTVRVGILDPADNGYFVKGAPVQAGKYFRAVDSTGAEEFSVDSNGTVSGLNIAGPFGLVTSIVLDAAETVPEGLPTGTIILRRPA